MRLVSVVSESSGESFDLMPTQLTPYNLSTLFGLTKISVLAQPAATPLTAVDNVYQVPEDCKVCRVTGEPVPLPEDKNQAKQKQQLMAGAKVRLLKSISDAQQETKAAEHQALQAAAKPPQRVSPVPPPHREPGTTSPPPPLHTTSPTNVNPQHQQQLPTGPPSVSHITVTSTNPSPPSDKVEVKADPAPAPGNEKVRCQFCGTDIPVQNKLLHEANCKRHKVQCQHCGLYFTESTLAAHIEENHTMSQCTFCSRSFKPSLLAEHTARCEERLVPCKYCNENIALSMMKFHEDQCDSRTEKCPYCGMVIGMNLQASHRMECQGQQSAGGRGRGGLDTSKPVDVTSRVQRYTATPPVDVDELDEDELLARALYQSQLEAQGRTAPTAEPERPVSLSSSPPEGVTEEELSMELIRKLQREQQEADAAYARQLAMGGSEGSFSPPREEDYRPPVSGTQQPTRMAGGYNDEDAEMLNQRLIQQMMAEQEAQNQRLSELLVRGLSRPPRGGAGVPPRGAGSSSRSPSYPLSGSDSDLYEHAEYLGTVPVSSTGRVRPTATGRGGTGSTSRGSGSTSSPLMRGGTGSTRVPPASGRGRKTPPPPARPSSALARPGETDEELARRLAVEEYGNS
jgi:hypothetical protein